MIKCAFCNKEINVGLDPATGQAFVNTKYWKGDNEDRKYFCDAKCSLDAHERDRRK